jgi:hypothetical protein
MLLKVLATAGLVAVFAISAASAQSLAGPAETPPSSFKGSQYVDSRGCVFLRAGIGGRTNWVPRINRGRKPLCNQPNAKEVKQALAAEPAAPAPRAAKTSSAAVGKPMDTIANLPRSRVKPAAQAPVAAQTVAAVKPQPAPKNTAPIARRQSGCPATAPYGARVALTDGRRSLICSANQNFDVRAAAKRIQVARNAPEVAPTTPVAPALVAAPKPPVAVRAAKAGTGYRCPASAPVARRYQIRGGGSTVLCVASGGGLETATPPLALGDVAEFRVPKGYRKAWKDGRLNPQRGKGTARGQAQQDQVWTHDLPAQLVTNAQAAKTVKRKVYATSASNSKSQPAPTAGRYFVQVGTFGEPANASKTAARLQKLGLPVAKSRITSKGRKLQIVLAGPFGDTSAANAALSKARRSGFGDAFIR